MNSIRWRCFACAVVLMAICGTNRASAELLAAANASILVQLTASDTDMMLLGLFVGSENEQTVNYSSILHLNGSSYANVMYYSYRDSNKTILSDIDGINVPPFPPDWVNRYIVSGVANADLTGTITSVPELSSFVLLSLGILGLLRKREEPDSAARRRAPYPWGIARKTCCKLSTHLARRREGV